MNAILIEAFGQRPIVTRVADPTPPADGVVVRVEACGICRSDWHGWMGHDSDIRLPHVPGHELAGVIVATGKDVQRHQHGTRVTVPFAVGCGTCRECVSGNHQICDHYYQPGFTGWGAFAEYVAIPHADVNLVPLPDAIGFVAAAALGCRFITAFRAVTAQGRVTGGDWVAVHGCGGVGLSAIMIAHALGANVIGVDINDDALGLAHQFGAVATLNAQTVDDIPAAIHELTDGGAHVALDALGSPQTCRNTTLSLRKRGRHVQVGLLLAGDQQTPLPLDRVIGWELEIVGSHGMQAHAYANMLAMISAGQLQPERLVTRTVGLPAAPQALATMNTFSHAGVTVIDHFDVHDLDADHSAPAV